MGRVTQSELAKRYGLKLPFLSTVMKNAGVLSDGYVQGEKKLLRTFDDQEATTAIIRHLYIQYKNRLKEYEEAKKTLSRVRKAACAKGLITREWKE